MTWNPNQHIIHLTGVRMGGISYVGCYETGNQTRENVHWTKSPHMEVWCIKNHTYWYALNISSPSLTIIQNMPNQQAIWPRHKLRHFRSIFEQNFPSEIQIKSLHFTTKLDSIIPVAISWVYMALRKIYSRIDRATHQADCRVVFREW